MTSMPSTTSTLPNLVELVVGPALDVRISLSSKFTLLIFLIVLLIAVIAAWRRASWFNTLEIDQAEIGIGQNKIRLRPNDVDRQIAYKIWVELSTRKIGLEIDLDHDVVAEIYDSWHTFFTVTRELIKDVPVAKFRRKDTEKIVSLSIEVLNHGLRPHLTKWQARFRRWYEWQSGLDTRFEQPPQDIQKQFPDYGALAEDLLAVNARLMAYRRKMHQIVVGTRDNASSLRASGNP